MVTYAYDVAVVGGGPAGSAAAFTLANAGVSVCLIDKSKFPRNKLCGGLITLRSKGIFEQVFHRQWDENLFTSSRDVHFISNGRPLASLHNYSTLYFTMRFDFDAYLLGLAESVGCKMYLGNAVSVIEFERRRLQLSDGSTIEFAHLIGADGVNSLCAKYLFGRSFDPRTIGFGLEVEVPRNSLPQRDNSVDIDFGITRWGYGWVFPKQKTFTVGVGGIHDSNTSMKGSLDQFLCQHGISAESLHVKGQFIPFGDFRQRPGRDRDLLCGDAAGFVDPITGEGIAYAMQSGHAAAQAILEARKSGKPEIALDVYLRHLVPIFSSLKMANYWKWLIFPTFLRRTFDWAFSDASTLQRGYMDILAGELEYRELPRLFFQQVKKAIRKYIYLKR
ncbi:geranylgeranyl reductase family protein [Methylocystis sp. B8]|uniref:geranylgeranyl reductase family protein n=1 Tax=Methylocystis sp. B8 TaxID=544938 RepID=UPI0010FF29EE|nr:geranylgeranyl reductase family protein [Methylocystis sp. B8]TLG78136.1 geranylgeranyl reductase family protein [Methylocystis sp. B8]